MSLANGARLGPYEILAPAGAGGMGEVYRARDAKLGRDVAIKILPRAFTSAPDRLARFEREARMLAAVNHPNICAIYGLEETDGVQYLILELVDGDTLANIVQRGAQDQPRRALAIDEAANGVRVNSVSPGNIYTPLWQEAIDAAPDPKQYLADGEAAQLLGRMGTTEEVGRLCLFIAAEATFTTGVDHIISGGAELGYGRKAR